MIEQEINDSLAEIRNGLTMLDGIVNTDYSTGEGKLSSRQVDLVEKILALFKRMNWQIHLNAYKELKIAEDPPIQNGFMGTKIGAPVIVRPCGEEYKNKSYFGIYIGDVALSIGASIDQDVLQLERYFYNPGILIPELGKIVYGYESWWGEIKSEEELTKVITDDLIQNVWYVKALNKLQGNSTSEE